MADDKVNYITEGTIKEIDAGLLSFRLEPSRDFKREMCGKTAIIFAQEKPPRTWEADILSPVQDVSPESWFSFEDDNFKDLKGLEERKQDKEQETEKLQQEIKDLQARLEILTQLKRQELLKSLSDLKNNGTTIRIRVEKSNLPTGQPTVPSNDQPDIPKAITCDGLSIR